MHALPSRRAALAAFALVLPARILLAATTPGEAKDVTLRLSATGTVTAIDPAARQLTLEGARGPARYRLDPRVANVDQLRVGSRVRVDYVAALVLTLRRGGPEAQVQAESETRAHASAQPGVPVPLGTTVVAQVLAVDRVARSVRLKGPEGRVADYQVQDAADLVGVKPGDSVVAVVHEAVAVGVEPL